MTESAQQQVQQEQQVQQVQQEQQVGSTYPGGQDLNAQQYTTTGYTVSTTTNYPINGQYTTGDLYNGQTNGYPYNGQTTSYSYNGQTTGYPYNGQTTNSYPYNGQGTTGYTTTGYNTTGGYGGVGSTLVSNGRNLLDSGRNDYLQSSDGIFTLKMQSDGNLVLNRFSHPIDASHTWHKGGGKPYKAIIENDGYFRIRDKNGKATFTKGRPGQGPFRVVLQDDSRVILYDSQGQSTIIL